MIIYLNGTSSAGKSSIAMELQSVIKKPVFYFSIDTLLYSLSKPIIDAIQGQRQPEVELDWSLVFRGYFECVATLQRTGNSVIADCPVYSQGLQKFFEMSVGSEVNKLVVGIQCPVEILREREQRRGDRVLGLAEKQSETIHSFLKYDLEVDSHLHSPGELAKLILENAQRKGLLRN